MGSLGTLYLQYVTANRAPAKEFQARSSESVSRSVMSEPLQPVDCGPPGFSVHGISQAILEWVVIPFSRGSSRPRDLSWASGIAGRFFTVWATRNTSKVTLRKWYTLCGVLASMPFWVDASFVLLDKTLKAWEKRNSQTHTSGRSKQASQHEHRTHEKAEAVRAGT